MVTSLLASYGTLNRVVCNGLAWIGGTSAEKTPKIGQIHSFFFSKRDRFYRRVQKSRHSHPNPPTREYSGKKNFQKAPAPISAPIMTISHSRMSASFLPVPHPAPRCLVEKDIKDMGFPAHTLDAMTVRRLWWHYQGETTWWRLTKWKISHFMLACGDAQAN